MTRRALVMTLPSTAGILLCETVLAAEKPSKKEIEPDLIKFLEQHPEKNQDPAAWRKVTFKADPGYEKLLATKIGEMDPFMRQIFEVNTIPLFEGAIVYQTVKDGKEIQRGEEVTINRFPAYSWAEEEAAVVLTRSPYAQMWATRGEVTPEADFVFYFSDPRQKPPTPAQPNAKPGIKLPKTL